MYVLCMFLHSLLIFNKHIKQLFIIICCLSSIYIIITTLVSLVKIENTIQDKEKLNLLSNTILSLKNEYSDLIFKYYSIAKITFRIILVLSQINPKVILVVIQTVRVVRSHGPSSSETRAEWSAGRDTGRVIRGPRCPVSMGCTAKCDLKIKDNFPSPFQEVNFVLQTE